MVKRKYLYWGLSLVISSTLFNSPALAAEKYVLRISHTDRANSIKGKFFIRFKELLEGRHPNISVQLSEYGKLAKRKQEIEALELGTIDMIAPDVEDLYEKNQEQTLKLLTLPFLFEKNQDYYKFLNSPVRVSFIKAITNNSKAYIPMSVMGEGFDMFMGKNPMKGLSDIQDKNLVANSVKINQTFYNQMKIKSVEYSDFQDIPYLSNISKGNIYEVNKQNYMNQDMGEYFPNMLLSNHKYTSSIILVNKIWFDKLPENIKKSINDLFVENAKYNSDLIEKNEEIFKERVGKIYKNSMVELSSEDRNEMKRLSQPIHEYYAERINRKVLMDTYKIIQK